MLLHSFSADFFSSLAHSFAEAAAHSGDEVIQQAKYGSSYMQMWLKWMHSHALAAASMGFI